MEHTHTESPAHRKQVIANTRALLRANDERSHLEGIETVRHEAIEELWPEVLALFSSENERVVETLCELLIDVHASSLILHLGNTLEAEWEAERLARILSICWQSPLDFSPLIPQLLPYLTHPDLQVVIEAMTSLEIAFDHASRVQLQEAVSSLKAFGKEEKRHEVRLLLEELVSTASRTLQQVVNAEREAKNAPQEHHHEHDDECTCGCH